MDNAWRELLEELQDNEEQVIKGVIVPMACVTLAFVGGLLIGAWLI